MFLHPAHEIQLDGVQDLDAVKHLVVRENRAAHLGTVPVASLAGCDVEPALLVRHDADVPRVQELDLGDEVAEERLGMDGLVVFGADGGAIAGGVGGSVRKKEAVSSFDFTRERTKALFYARTAAWFASSSSPKGALASMAAFCCFALFFSRYVARSMS